LDLGALERLYNITKQLQRFAIPLPSCLPTCNPVSQTLTACVDKTLCLGNDVPLKDLLPDLQVLKNRVQVQLRWLHTVIITAITASIVLLDSSLDFNYLGEIILRDVWTAMFII
jgi:hypothetical protein